MTRGTRNRLLVCLTAFAVLTVALAAFLNGFMISGAARKRSRDEITELHRQIDLGMSRNRVEVIYAGMNSEILSLHKLESEWVVQTPIEWAATNWIMVIAFCRNTVSEVRVGTADDFEPPAAGAPPDKIAADGCTQ